MGWILLGAAFLGAFAASLAATGAILVLLRRRAILDLPNPRSLHSRPTPRGGGLAVMAVVLASWAAVWAAGAAPAGEARAAAVVSLVALALSALFWLDDLKGLPVAVRLAGQFAAVGAALALAPPPGPVFGGLLPPAWDTVAAALAWVWFVNLFNFMDGIDGISGVEAAAIGLGAALVAAIAGFDTSVSLQGATAAGAALGFLWWNWQPARIFLGDVGSVGLGFVLGWLLLGLAARGQWAAALILPLYYLADATLTLGGRALRREPVWRPHREHFYQKAVRRGKSHAAVTRAVLAADLALVGLAALAASGFPLLALLGAGLAVAALLRHFSAGAGVPAPTPP